MQFWFHHYTRMSGIISENLESKQFPFFQILTNNHSRDNFHFSILVKLFPTQHLPALALLGFLAQQVLFRGSQLPQWLETEYLSPLFKPDFSSWKQSICLLFSNQISFAGNRVFICCTFLFQQISCFLTMPIFGERLHFGVDGSLI